MALYKWFYLLSISVRSNLRPWLV